MRISSPLVIAFTVLAAIASVAQTTGSAQTPAAPQATSTTPQGGADPRRVGSEMAVTFDLS